MADQDKAILTALAQHTSYLHRVSTRESNKLIGTFNKIGNTKLSLIRDLFDELTSAERTALSGGVYSTQRLVKIREALTEWQKELNTELYDQFESGAVALAEHESEYIARLSGEAVAVASGKKIVDAAKKIPLTGGALVKELFSALGEQLRKNVERSLRDGIANGLTNQQIWKEIKGASDLPEDRTVFRQTRIEIDRVVRTARNHIGNEAYIETFKALGYTHLKFVATLDGRTSKECASLDSELWEINDPKIKRPPRHPNCRSMLVGTDADGKLIGRRPFVMADKPVSKIPKDARDGVVGQVNSNTSFKTWFDKDATESFKREWLGKTKYELYKKGGYSIDRFVDPLGKPYTIAELRSLDEKTFKELGL